MNKLVEFKTKVYTENTDGDNKPNIIGAEVTVYSSAGDNIGSIQITSKKDFDELMERLDDIDVVYVSKSELQSEVSNLTINAATLGGKSSTDFALSNHNHDAQYYTQTKINNKLNWRSEELITGAKLWYNDLFCCLELIGYKKTVTTTTANGTAINLSIPMDRGYLPATDSAGNSDNQNMQVIVFKDNGTDSSRVQLKRFQGKFSENEKVIIDANVIWRRRNV